MLTRYTTYIPVALLCATIMCAAVPSHLAHTAPRVAQRWQVLGAGAVGQPGLPALRVSHAPAGMITPLPPGPTTYYVSPDGNDASSGSSLATPWRSIARVNSARLHPGDTVLFQGGQTFSGKLYFTSAVSGTATNPITIGSYGTARATLMNTNDTAVYMYNTSGFLFSNISVRGQSVTNVVDGVSFYNDLPGDIKLPYVHFDRVDVSGFKGYGISLGGGNGASGYSDVRVTNATLHDNGRGGLDTYGPTGVYANANVYVGATQAYDNIGFTGSYTPTGSGIVLSDVISGTIERSSAFNNGTNGTGGVGVWAFQSRDVTIQGNESYNNHTVIGSDGDGFDLDQGTVDSTMQYNYAHGNDGAGFLLCENGLASSGNTVRYNISENDARRNYYGGIVVYGPENDADIYNNTVYVSPANGGTHGVGMYNWTGSNIHWRNNIIDTVAGVPSVVALDHSTGVGLSFQGNDYYTSGAPFQIVWNGATYSNLSSWRVATSQEVVSGTQTGLTVDPGFVNPGGGTVGDPTRLDALTAYTLRATSPMVDVGLNLPTLFGVNPGVRDFNGGAIPSGAGFDLGAYEIPAAVAHTVTPAPTPSTDAPILPSAPPTATSAPPTATSAPSKRKPRA